MKEFIDVKGINTKVANALIDKWGVSKFIKVVSAAAIGAGVFAIVAESRIPDEPKIQ